MNIEKNVKKTGRNPVETNSEDVDVQRTEQNPVLPRIAEEAGRDILGFSAGAVPIYIGTEYGTEKLVTIAPEKEATLKAGTAVVKIGSAFLMGYLSVKMPVGLGKRVVQGGAVGLVLGGVSDIMESMRTAGILARYSPEKEYPPEEETPEEYYPEEYPEEEYYPESEGKVASITEL